MYHLGVCETHRVDTTRLRFCSHKLKIETGRWARISHEEHLCSYADGNIQSESHNLIDCEYTFH